MAQPDTFYMAFRPETKCKEKHAVCRQYCFDTTADLLKWLRSRRNSQELIYVDVIVQGRLIGRMEDERCALSTHPTWPLP